MKTLADRIIGRGLGIVVLLLVLVVSGSASPQEKILDFPINWDKRGGYCKFLPTNEQGKRGAWSCGQVAHAMIVRYLAMHHDLQIQGSHFYCMRVNGQKVSADFDAPFRWDEMLPSLKGIPIDDPRGDPVADFVYRFCVAMRTDWWDPNGKPWVSDYHAKEALTRYYGIDVTEYRRGPLAKWAEEHSWDALYERINRDIDAGLPCELVVAGIGKVCHEVIITGYRKVDDHYEYTIHFGGDRYDPSRTFRLDRPVAGWDAPHQFLISWGIKPYAEGERAPLYNTILQEIGALHTHSRTDIVWNGNEYALVMPSSRNGDRTVVFKRINRSGRATGKRVVLTRAAPDLPKPAIEWGNGLYAVAWLGSDEPGLGIHMNLLTETGDRFLPSDVYMGDGTQWPNIAWSGNRFGLAYLDHDDVKLALVGEDGAVPKTVTVAKGKASPNLVWTGRNFAVSCLDTNTKEACLRLFDEDAGPLGDLSRLKVEGATHLSECRIASTGGGYGLAFIKHHASDSPVLMFCLADKKGAFVPDTVTSVPSPERNVRTVDLSFQENVFYITFRCCNASHSLCLSRISLDGNVIDRRWLAHRPNSVCHTQGPDGVNVMSFRNIPPGEGIEVISCIVPRVEAAKPTASRGGGSLLGGIAAALLLVIGGTATMYRWRATRARPRQEC